MTAQTTTWIVPKGTKVVLLQQKDDVNGKGFIKPGTVGLVQECPTDNGFPYTILFPLNRTMSDKEADTFLPEDRIAKAAVLLHEFSIQKEAVRNHLDSMREAAESYLSRLALRVVMGSTSYGLKVAGSDIDYKGIYIVPTDVATSLYGFEKSFNGKFEGNDFEYKEIQEMLLTLLKGNSTYIETLYAPHPEVFNPFAQELLDNRHRFVSKNIFGSYGGYAISQFELLARGGGKRWHAKEGKRGKAAKGGLTVSTTHGLRIEDHDYESLEASGVNWKHASHLIRLLIAGTYVMDTGEVLVDFTGHPDRDILIQIKKGEIPLRDVFKLKDAWVAKFNGAFSTTKVQDVPDAAWANDFLVRVRRAN